MQIQTKKMIVWMGTFKHHKNKKRADFNNGNNDISIMTKENFAMIQEKLSRHDITLVIKPHPSQDMDMLKIITSKNIKILTNEMLAKANVEPYELLGTSDALITDFSSVYFDYLLIDKPIAFELTDKTAYDNGIGFIIEQPLNYMPGYKIYSINDFLDFLKNVADNKDSYKKARYELRRLNHKFADNHSTERVLQYFSIIGKNND